MEHSAHVATNPTNPTESQFQYRERLYIPWWGWPVPLAIAVTLATSVHLGAPKLPIWLPYTILFPLTVILLLALGRLAVRVTGGQDPQLWVKDAHLPLRFIGTVEVIEKQDKQKALGPELDPAAFLMQRGWITSLVRIHLTDPDDPTPYWLISTRHPEKLATILSRPNSDD